MTGKTAPVDSRGPERRPTGTRRVRPRSQWVALGVIVVVAALAAAAVALWGGSQKRAASGPECHVTVGTTTYPLDGEQASTATTVAAVGKRLGLPDHAVTVALATALQESGLRNLNHGDRDSLGVFQQRSSQGWGTPTAILTPRLAAAAFYERLVHITAWQSLPVTSAAQAVQRSNAPSAYAHWEHEARVVARALTGEVPAGLSCQFEATPGRAHRSELTITMSRELGNLGAGTAVTAARGWTVATWLVGHAHAQGITSVQFSGRTWTAASGAWSPGASGDLSVHYE